jgi:hypothetical protein
VPRRYTVVEWGSELRYASTQQRKLGKMGKDVRVTLVFHSQFQIIVPYGQICLFVLLLLLVFD